MIKGVGPTDPDILARKAWLYSWERWICMWGTGNWKLDEELGDEGRRAAKRERLLDLVHANNMQV